MKNMHLQNLDKESEFKEQKTNFSETLFPEFDYLYRFYTIFDSSRVGNTALTMSIQFS